MNDTVRIVGAPTDYGASRRGVDMGPPAIRYADLAAALSGIGLDPRNRGDLPARGANATTPAATTRST
jgi:arginase